MRRPLWRVLASTLSFVLILATGAWAVNTPTETPTSTATGTATATLTPVPTAALPPAGVSSSYPGLNTSTTGATAWIDTRGYGSGSVQVTIGSCSSYTLKIEGCNNAADCSVPGLLATYTASDVAASASKVFAITPFPLKFVRNNLSAASSCTVQTTNTFRP